MKKEWEKSLKEDSMPELLLILLICVVVIIGLEAFCGLILWGICSFIIWAFGISFTFTFWHGLAISFIISILASIFRR